MSSEADNDTPVSKKKVDQMSQAELDDFMKQRLPGHAQDKGRYDSSNSSDQSKDKAARTQWAKDIRAADIENMSPRELTERFGVNPDQYKRGENHSVRESVDSALEKTVHETAHPEKYRDFSLDELEKKKANALAFLAGALDAAPTAGSVTTDHMISTFAAEVLNIAKAQNEKQAEAGGTTGPDGHTHLRPADLAIAADLLRGELQEDGDDNLVQTQNAAKRHVELSAEIGDNEAAAQRFAEEIAILLREIALEQARGEAHIPAEQVADQPSHVAEEYEDLSIAELDYQKRSILQQMSEVVKNMSDIDDNNDRVIKGQAAALVSKLMAVAGMLRKKDGTAEAELEELKAHYTTQEQSRTGAEEIEEAKAYADMTDLELAQAKQKLISKMSELARSINPKNEDAEPPDTKLVVKVEAEIEALGLETKAISDEQNKRIKDAAPIPEEPQEEIEELRIDTSDVRDVLTIIRMEQHDKTNELFLSAAMSLYGLLDKAGGLEGEVPSHDGYHVMKARILENTRRLLYEDERPSDSVPHENSKAKMLLEEMIVDGEQKRLNELMQYGGEA